MNLEKAQEEYHKRQLELNTIRRQHEAQVKEYSEFLRARKQQNGSVTGRG